MQSSLMAQQVKELLSLSVVWVQSLAQEFHMATGTTPKKENVTWKTSVKGYSIIHDILPGY